MLSNEIRAVSRAIETIKKALAGEVYESAVKICGGKVYDDVRDMCAKLVGIADAFALGAGQGGGSGNGGAAINQPAYTNEPLHNLMAQSNSIAIANFFMSDSSSVWRFNDVSKVFVIKSLDGASRIVGDGERVRIYYQREQSAQISADGGTYQFLGPALFRGLDGYTGDISEITITQNALQVSERELAATIANAVGWLQRQIDELSAKVSDDIDKIKLGSLDELVAENNAVTIPFVDTEETHHDPFDLGQFEAEAGLPQPAPSNDQYYAGVAEGAQVKKYTSVFSGNADTRLNPVQCFETDDAPSEAANTFNELRIGTNGGAPVSVAQYNEWCAANAYDAGKIMQVTITKNEQYPIDADVGRISIEAAYFKGNPRMLLSWWLDSTQIFASGTGAYVFGSVNQVIDMSAVPGWAAGDTLHLDGAAGKVWAEDAAGNRISLRCAVLPGGVEMARWATGRDWLNHLGFSAWRVGQGGWEWQDSGSAYTPGGSITGQNVNGVLRWTQYAAMINRFGSIEAENAVLKARLDALEGA
jgi:hypothetical protein